MTTATLEKTVTAAPARTGTPTRESRRSDAARPGTRSRDRERARTLLAQLAALPENDQRRTIIRCELVSLHTGLVHYLARRFAGRGEPHDDLAQVATIGLLKAIDRFDPDRGLEFSTFAIPTMLGEIRRHFRDTGWAVHVPRRMQELSARVSTASTELAADLGRAPTVGELAGRLGVTPERILEGLECTRAYSALTLDAPATGSSGTAPSLAETLGQVDPALETVEVRETVRPLLAALPERERRIVVLRFFKNMTQTQIAAEVGLSQMHVSRLLAQSLKRLHRLATTDPDGHACASAA